MGSECTVECPVCECDGVASTVRQHTASARRPIRRFRDDDGTVHVHEPEPIEMPYECSEGHQFEVEEMIPCPACGWRGSA